MVNPEVRNEVLDIMFKYRNIINLPISTMDIYCKTNIFSLESIRSCVRGMERNGFLYSNLRTEKVFKKYKKTKSFRLEPLKVYSLTEKGVEAYFSIDIINPTKP